MNYSKLLKKRVWAVWCALLLASTLIQWPTLRISPPIWQDEVQIVDYGRVAMGGDDRFGLNLLTDGHSMEPICWVGCVIQEFAYKLCQDPLGPRLSSMIGATLAATALLGWLVARGVLPGVALACAAAFFWDPVFAAGYRGARVDCWAMAAMLVGLWVVWLSTRTRSSWATQTALVISGLFIGMSGVIWVSTILLVPLVIFEVYKASKTKIENPAKIVALAYVLIGIGAIVCLCMALLPKSEILGEILRNLQDGVGRRTSAPKTLDSVFLGFLSSFYRSPIVPILAFMGLVLLRNVFLFGVVSFAIIGILITGPYIHRAVYLLPYLYLTLALSLSLLLKESGTSKIKCTIAISALIIMVIWSGGVTLGARTYVSISSASSREPDLILDELIEEIGPNKKIYLGTWDAYYAARELGCEFNKFLYWPGNESPAVHRVMQESDYALFQQDDNFKLDDDLMKKWGFSSKVIKLKNELGNDGAYSNRLQSVGYRNYILHYRPDDLIEE